MTKKKSISMKDSVDPDVYSTWIKMLKVLVPHGRTHRLSVVVASMLQYVVVQNRGKNSSLSDAFEMLADSGDYEAATEKLLPFVKEIFKDAKVKCERVSARGQHYSIAEESIREFFSWDLMPWE